MKENSTDGAEGSNGKRKELVEGVDYYLEKGKYVFTAHYLRERGYCCKSGCRHCPYGYNQNN